MPEPSPAAPYLTHADQVAIAADLIARFGPAAEGEAARHAGRSRDIGNQIHFCRWRQVERLIRLLSADTPTGTIH